MTRRVRDYLGTRAFSGEVPAGSPPEMRFLKAKEDEVLTEFVLARPEPAIGASVVTNDTSTLSQTRSSGMVVVAAAIVAGLLVVSAGALWTYYGTAVFYEIILAGLNACF